VIKQILIVNESRLIREALGQILLDCNIAKSSIAYIENLDDAVEFIEIFPCDLLICSHQLEGRPFSDFITLLNPNGKFPTLVLNSDDMAAINHTGSTHAIAPPFNKQRIVSALFSLTDSKLFVLNSTEKQREQVKVAEQESPPTLANTFEKPTILVVDDESSNIDVAAGNLRSAYRVIAAKSGEQALKIVSNPKFTIDLILLDIMMPDMDGYQVCKAIKEQTNNADIPIIFLSAKSEVDDIKHGFELGAVDYITKPLLGDILRARVATHIRLRKNTIALANKVCALIENAKLREDIEKITQHDLKGPLNNILFETYNLENRPAAESINRAVNNVVNMINNSLNLYKIEQGNYHLMPESTNISVIVHDAINSVSLSSDEKKITFLIQGLNIEHKANAEPLLCLSIFNNLIKNAVEASPFNETIEISLTTTDGYVVFETTNQGVVPIALRANLFEKYTSSDHNKGTGLGTYSAKLMTEVQQGSISFDIINEQKTRFYVKLPVA
jgi:DNA-binding response OmpR family regulator